eukprot:IDg19506t1
MHPLPILPTPDVTGPAAATAVAVCIALKKENIITHCGLKRGSSLIRNEPTDASSLVTTPVFEQAVSPGLNMKISPAARSSQKPDEFIDANFVTPREVLVLVQLRVVLSEIISHGLDLLTPTCAVSRAFPPL